MTKKQLEEKVKLLEENAKRIQLQNFTVIGNKWESDSLKTVQTVADALKNLTDLFKHQDVNLTLNKDVVVHDTFRSKLVH